LGNLYNPWLDKIDEDLRHFKPKTALEHLEKLINAIGNKFDSKLNARISFLKGLCLYESGDAKNWMDCFIVAYNYDATVAEYLERALLAYFKKREHAKIPALIETLLTIDKNNPIAWAAKLFIDKNAIIPNIILEIQRFKQKFKGTFATFCLMADCTQRLQEVFETELIPKDESIEVNFYNKAYWLILSDYRLSNITFKVFKSIFPIPKDVVHHPHLKKVVKDLKSVLIAFENTEQNDKQKFYRFLLAYGEYLISSNIEKVHLMRQLFDTTANLRNNHKVLLLIASAYFQSESYNSILQLPTQAFAPFGDYMKVNAYLKLRDLSNAEAAGKLYFDKIPTMHFLELTHFCDFQTNIINSDEKRLFYFDRYQNMGKYSTIAIEKVAKICSCALTLDKAELLQLANEVSEVSYEDFDDQIKCRVAERLFQKKAYVEATKMMEPFIDFDEYTSNFDFYLENLYLSQTRNSRLLQLLVARRHKKVNDVYWLLIEIELLRQIKDLKQIEEVVDAGLKLDATHPKLMLYKIENLYLLGKRDELKKYIELNEKQLFTYDFKITTFLCGMLWTIGYFDLIIKLLYDAAKKQKHPTAEEIYVCNASAINRADLKDVFLSQKKATQGTILILKDKESLISTPQEALDKQVGETFAIGRKIYTIAEIYDEYEGFFRILEKKFKNEEILTSTLDFFDTSDGIDIDAFHQWLQQMLGKTNEKNNRIQKRLIEEYKRGERDFSYLAAWSREPFDIYWRLIQTEKEFQLLPMTIIHIAKHHFETDVQFVLDHTSVPLFFELSNRLQLNFNHKFYIADSVMTYYENKLATANLHKDSPMSWSITTTEVIPHFHNPDELQEQFMYLQRLCQWLKEHCQTRPIPEKLDLLPEIAKLSEKFGADYEKYLTYLIDTRFLASEDNTYLITDDTVFLGYIGIGKILTTEYYLRMYFAESYAEKILPILLSFNFIGISLTCKILAEECTKHLNGQPNMYENCLKNLHFSYNLQNISLAIALVKAIYNLRDMEMEERSIQVQQVFGWLIGDVYEHAIVGFCLFCIENDEECVFMEQIKADFIKIFK
jgi:hypothetical protein